MKSGDLRLVCKEPRVMDYTPCDLEIQVNEEHAFFLRQKPLAAYSGRLSKIFRRLTLRSDGSGLPRILLHDFPGGGEAFELATRFCYDGGRIAISNSNVSVLRCVGEFLEMTEAYARGNLVKQAEMHLQNLGNDWDSNLTVLKGCDAVLPLAEKTHIVQRCADTIAWKICSSLEDMSPLSSSPDSYRLHSGSISRRSSLSTKISPSRTWWFSDVSSLSVFLMERLLKSLIYNDLDNKLLARFLMHYLKTAVPLHLYSGFSAKLRSAREETLHNRSKKVHVAVLEAIVNLFFHLERGSTSCRSLFIMLRVATVLNASKPCKRQLEKMIGSQLHDVNLDSILLPLYPRSGSLFDVDLVIRLVEYFFREQDSRGALCLKQQNPPGDDAAVMETPVTRVGDLIDTYLAEIAPDTSLKVHRFRRLAQALPASARWTHDGLYRAVDSYLEAHPDVMSAEVLSLCQVLDVGKLSLDACKHIAKNPRLPSKFVLEVLAFQQGRLRECIVRSDHRGSRGGSHRRTQSDIPDQSAGTHELLRTDLDQIHFKVGELEKACKSMRSDVSRYNRAARRLLC
ncbi:hypothetical protein SELMODRAFT_429270 [Selaginella moellendorffii]|uniref:NPH3 domain-containing protein n=1 Tax=Selaginella moellendorffii TaxID=88036 RepID=D8T5L8_SELML|nr:root phototropism protein 3 [Selaginella moellendorffii]XP_024520497.1 root phototropism protein 3 [Selaginella moellendorffii]EFJ07986.1 hypothetical protein SELMODRAFT_429270 [Selaginella moellendorffii]|eukprot:XP_002990942.1 root phototropism protein 3 [Selaginella moellendorffii]